MLRLQAASRKAIFRKLLHRLEQRPCFTLYVDVVVSQDSRQAGKRFGNLGVALLHERNATVDRGRDGEVVIGDLPQKLGSRRSLGVGFSEAGNLAEAVQYQPDSLPASRLPQILLDTGGAP